MTGAEKSEIKDYQALKKRNIVVLVLLGIILTLAMLFSLRAGSSDLNMGDILKAMGNFLVFERGCGFALLIGCERKCVKHLKNNLSSTYKCNFLGADNKQ